MRMFRWLFLMAAAGCGMHLQAADISVQFRLDEAIRAPIKEHVSYNQVWTPPNEAASVRMDCSNTVQWLVRRCEGVYLPRTASAQYEFLKSHRQLFKVSRNAQTVRSQLHPGDVLFWENTYAPKRRPPITHAMVYYGTDASGKMWMIGSQTSHGVGMYTFNPEAKMGGYRFFFGLFKRPGRFIAYGRPLAVTTGNLPY